MQIMVKVNAWHSPEGNSVNIPISYLLSRYRADDPLWAGNYARLGVVVGHELAHAFDRNGIAWSMAYRNEPLFASSANSSFHSVFSCLIEQYSTFCPLQWSNNSLLCVDGGKTADENWADAVGIRLAYDAYERRLNASGRSIDDAMAPGGPTYAQEFFTELARDWCASDSEDEIHQHLLSTDEHSPNKYRILGVLQNFPEFHRAFGCLDGNGLLPSARCPIWSGGEDVEIANIIRILNSGV